MIIVSSVYCVQIECPKYIPLSALTSLTRTSHSLELGTINASRSLFRRVRLISKVPLLLELLDVELMNFEASLFLSKCLGCTNYLAAEPDIECKVMWNF